MQTASFPCTEVLSISVNGKTADKLHSGLLPPPAATGMADADSIFSQKSCLPDNTIFYSIFPDFSSSAASYTEELHNLHLHILQIISPYTKDYIFQHQPFTLTPISSPLLHLHGNLRFGDNLEDEWFVVFLLFTISKELPKLSISVHDTDGQFLLIETAFRLPGWLNPETSTNRVFIRRGRLYILPRSVFPTMPPLHGALKFLSENDDNPEVLRATPDAVQFHLEKKINEYPERANENMHRARVRVPISVAWVLKHEPCFIALAVEGFYDRDVDSMKYADKMEKFLPNGRQEELVQVVVKMSRAMYAQLKLQTFRPPKCYPSLPPISDSDAYKEAELGMKIACGFEMMYQLRKRQGEEGKESTWDIFKETLEKSGYFQGLLPGSKEYNRLMENAKEYYKNSSAHSRAREMLIAPVKCVDEILSLPHSANDFEGQELPVPDDDSWLYNGDDELNAALEERQHEMEFFESRNKRKQKMKKKEDGADYDLGEIANSMQAFMKKISDYKGAEVPKSRTMEDVELDVDQFMKDMESVMRHKGFDNGGNDSELEEGSSSDMEFDDLEDEDLEEDNEEGKDFFMRSYTDTLNKQLKGTTLDRSFIRANDHPLKKAEGTSNTTEDMDADFTPVDVDVNLIKNLLDSYSSQEGLPGPASNMLGLMGLQLPQDNKKGK